MESFFSHLALPIGMEQIKAIGCQGQQGDHRPVVGEKAEDISKGPMAFGEGFFHVGVLPAISKPHIDRIK